MKNKSISPVFTGLIIGALVLACIAMSALPNYFAGLIERLANEKAQTIQAQADAALKYAAVRQMDVATDALQRDVVAANAWPYAMIGALVLALVVALIVNHNEKRIAEKRHRELVDLLREATGVQSQRLRELAQ